MLLPQTETRSTRLHYAALTPIGEAGRTEMVIERLTNSMYAGAFAEGERLPSESELGRLLGVSVVTVREALVALRSEGLITTKRGRGGGSFVALTTDDAELYNAKKLIGMPRVTLADLGLHYEMISAACAELACLRATEYELEVIQDVLATAHDLPQLAWRRRITDVQLELASLSQSVSITDEHVRVQTQFTPLLALQDIDERARKITHEALTRQVEAIIDEDIDLARLVVREDVRRTTRWLIAFRERLLADPSDKHIRYELQQRGSVAEESAVAENENEVAT